MVSTTARRVQPLQFVRTLVVLLGVTSMTWTWAWAWAFVMVLFPIPNATVVSYVDGFSDTAPWMLRPSFRRKILPAGSTRTPLLRSKYLSADSIAEGGRAALSSSSLLAIPSSATPVSASSKSTLHPRIESVFIEYCPGCRWMTKAFWMATELLLQHSAPGELGEVTVIPSEPGTFNITTRVRPTSNEDSSESKSKLIQLWDRKADGGFPPIDLIEFEKRLKACLENRSDVAVAVAVDVDVAVDVSTATVDTDGGDSPFLAAMLSAGGDDASSVGRGRSHVVIKYCRSSGYLLRAAYYGQELLTTFSEGELEAISLQPIPMMMPIDGLPSGCFSVELKEYRGKGEEQSTSLSSLVLWDKSDSGRFPEVKELKRLVRDTVTPQKDLGHSEDKTHSSNNNNNNSSSSSNITGEGLVAGTMEKKKNLAKELVDDVGDCIPCNAAASDTEKNDYEEEEDDDDDDDDDDDEAEEARRFFGVM